MKQDQKRILQIIIILVVILLILFAVLIINLAKSKAINTQSANNVENSTQNELNALNTENISNVYPNLSTPKDVCDYLGCTYIDTKKSSDSNCKQDIYMNFNTETTDSTGRDIYSNKVFYEDVILNIADKMNDNFRIIDDEHSIIVFVQLKTDSDTGNKNAGYIINNNPKFFEDEVSKRSLKQIIETSNEYSNITVKSDILQSLINNKWNAKISVQNMKSQDGDYYVYNGYKVKMLGDSVYNIVFDSDYKNEVFSGITTGSSVNDDILGDAYYFGTDIATPLGYRTKDFYAFFLNGKISVYKKDTFDQDKNEQLNSLMTKYNEDGDYASLIQNITKVYTDYIVTENSNNKIDIKFPLEGFELKFGYDDQNNGITIYDNFEGKVVNNKTLNDINQDGQIPNNVYIVYDNLMFQDSFNSLYDE